MSLTSSCLLLMGTLKALPPINYLNCLRKCKSVAITSTYPLSLWSESLLAAGLTAVTQQELMSRHPNMRALRWIVPCESLLYLYSLNYYPNDLLLHVLNACHSLTKSVISVDQAGEIKLSCLSLNQTPHPETVMYKSHDCI